MSQTASLYVGNLPYDTTDEQLRELFAAFGPVTDVRMANRRGFGFVDVPSDKMEAAIEGTNGKDFGGRTLTVNQARPKPERREGGGGGYRDRDRGRRGGYGGGGRDRDRDREQRW